MKVTNEMLAGFVGGQMEIQNQDEGYLYRGEVEVIAVENDEIQVKFVWLAKGEGFPPFPNRWVKDDHLDYAASLDIHSARNIGPSDGGEDGGGDRISFLSLFFGETVVLCPPDGSKLDPAKVEGLTLQ